MPISQQQIRKKFQEADVDNTGRIDAEQIRTILSSCDIEIPLVRVNKLIQKLYIYNRFNQLLLLVKPQVQKNKTQQKIQANNQIQQIQIKQKVDEQQQQQEIQEAFPDFPQISEYTANIEQFLKIFYLSAHSIDYNLFKLTIDLVKLQCMALYVSKKRIFPLKDPAPEAHIKITIGQQMKSYNSQLYVKLLKMPAEANEKDQEISLKFCIKHPSSQILDIIAATWQQTYQFIITLLSEQQGQGGKQFINSFKITTEKQPGIFTIKIVSNNYYLNQFIATISTLGDVCFKTQFKAKIQALLNFNFNLGQFITNKDCTLDDFLMKNIKITFKAQVSEIMSSIKQLVIANKALQGLSSVHDDDQSLLTIFILNFQNLNLDLKFRNDIFQNKSQELLYQILTMIKQFGQQISQQLAQVEFLNKLIKNLFKCKLNIELKALDFKVNADLQIENLDQILFNYQSEILKKYEGGEEDQ